jgi:PTS system N-acetylglucosamine-specific IIC component
VLNWHLATNPWLLFVIGPIYAVVYYAVFRGLIAVLDLKTPGREPDVVDEETGQADLEPAPAAPAAT